MIIGVIIAIVYTLGSVVDLYMETIAGTSGGFEIPAITNLLGGIDIFSWRLFVVAPMWLLVILISIIAIWIGYSMLTTPAPVPLEELEEELAAEEAAEEAAESS
jgi:dolichyl-phosphate-mannose--protein O-mannosyl transferase